MNEKFDITPTWQAVVASYLASIENTMFIKSGKQPMVNRKSFPIMGEELLRLARLADHWGPFIASGDAEEVSN